jgi:hypothetical protein
MAAMTTNQACIELRLSAEAEEEFLEMISPFRVDTRQRLSQQ